MCQLPYKYYYPHFIGCRNRDTEKLSKLPRIAQHMGQSQDSNPGSLGPESKFRTTML